MSSVSISKGDQFAEFLAIAPNNRIPASLIRRPEGQPISVFESAQSCNLGRRTSDLSHDEGAR